MMDTAASHRKKSVISTKDRVKERHHAELLRQVHQLTQRVSELEERVFPSANLTEDQTLVRERMVRRWEALNVQEDEEAQRWSQAMPHAA